jgi:hypothetical protein
VIELLRYQRDWAKELACELMRPDRVDTILDLVPAIDVLSHNLDLVVAEGEGPDFVA